MATYNELITSFQREPVLLVKLSIISPVDSSTVIFRFSTRENRPINIQLSDDVRPYLIGARGRPSRIVSERALTERSRITMTFNDDELAPDFDSAKFTVTKGLTFWKRLVLAQPDFIGSTIEVLRGFVSFGFIESSFQTIFKGRLEDIDFQTNGQVSLVAKDNLNFVDRQIPAEISDGNKLNGAIGSTTQDTFIVDKASEATDPSSLASKDLFPVVIRLEPGVGGQEEDIIVSGITSNTFSVQANHADKSEAFNSSPWVTTGTASVVADAAIGPLGGPVKAERLKFPAVNDTIEQTTGLSVSSSSVVFSVWLKTTAIITSPVGITLEGNDGVTTISATAVVTKDWKRFEVVGTLNSTVKIVIKRAAGQDVEVFAFGAGLEEASGRNFYAATDGNAGSAAGRGAFGSNLPASHPDDSSFREVLLYRQHLTDDGVHPIVILRDLVNRGELAIADVDQSSFDAEFNFQESLQFKRAGTTTADRPRTLLRHVKEVSEQALVDLWVSQAGKVKTKFSWRINIPGATTKTLNDAENIIFQSSSYKGNGQSRVTRVFLYYNLKAGETGDKPEDFSNVEIVVDLSVETVGGPRVKTIFSKWIFRTSEATGTAGRYVSRFKRGARLAKWRVDLKDDPDFDTGDFIELDSRDIPLATGATAVRAKTSWQVTQKDPKHREGFILVEALEGRGLKYAIISPAVIGKNDPFTGVPGTFPLAFKDANEDDRQYGFIGDAANNELTETDGTKVQGYVIL